MENSEFETRAFADPNDSAQDFLEALTANSERRQLVDEIRLFNERLGQITNSIGIPPELCNRLKAVAIDESPTTVKSIPQGDVPEYSGRKKQPLRLIAMAAALVLAVGVTFSTQFGNNQPSAAEMEFGQQVVNHVYTELDEISASTVASLQQISLAMGAIGSPEANIEAITSLGISFAKPCDILPRSRSAHLVINGNRGAVNIIIIDNSPVSRKFTFNDDRFSTVVVPLARGNLVLVGEKSERLADYQQLVDDNLTWAI